MNLLHFPDFYKIGIVISIFIGLIFLSYFEFDLQVKQKRSEALSSTGSYIKRVRIRIIRRSSCSRSTLSRNTARHYQCSCKGIKKRNW